MKRLIILFFIVGCEETLAPEDACGVAGGDGTTCADCAGVSNGDAELDIHTEKEKHTLRNTNTLR